MGRQFKQSAKRGFTLVELSIVIVIIGFLVAGIAAGSSMIKQAQLRSVITDIRSYQTAFNNFKSRFSNQVPGDMTTASSFWPTPQCALADDDCNGDGDGYIRKDITSAGLDETRPALKQLALAGMISAGIPEVPNTIVALVPGQNAPASKISGVGYYLTSTQALAGIGSSNFLKIGKPTTALAAGDDLSYAAFTPEDAYNIDVKLDDGYIVGASSNLFERAFSMFVNPVVAIDRVEKCGGEVLPAGGVGMGTDSSHSFAWNEISNSFINSAQANKISSERANCPSGATSGAVIAQCGYEFAICGISGGSYNFTITDPTVTVSVTLE